VLTARSFRLLIGGLWLSSCGYADLSPNLNRTIREIGIRLYYSQLDPPAATIGFFLHADRRNLVALEAELSHRRVRGENVGHLDWNCDELRRHREWLETVAASRGVDVTSAVEKFGQLNFRKVCQQKGIEKAYLVDYVLDSGHVHERDVTTNSFLSVRGDRGEYELGPTGVDAIQPAVFDMFRNFGLVADAAARLVDDPDATAEASRIFGSLLQVWESRQGSV
jgi:hypothetical protein